MTNVKNLQCSVPPKDHLEQPKKNMPLLGPSLVHLRFLADTWHKQSGASSGSSRARLRLSVRRSVSACPLASQRARLRLSAPACVARPPLFSVVDDPAHEGRGGGEVLEHSAVWWRELGALVARPDFAGALCQVIDPAPTPSLGELRA